MTRGFQSAGYDFLGYEYSLRNDAQVIDTGLNTRGYLLGFFFVARKIYIFLQNTKNLVYINNYFCRKQEFVLIKVLNMMLTTKCSTTTNNSIKCVLK